MKVSRRNFLHFITSASALMYLPQTAVAQVYPSRPVRWVVPFPPGGAADISARLMGQWLSERLGEPFVIENRPGAGGNIGTGMVATSRPDGYTLLLIGSFSAINATLYSGLNNFDFRRDIAPVAGIMRNPLVLMVNGSVPIKTVSELVAYAKAHPGKLNAGTGGIGSPQHMAGELFKISAGVDLVFVHYRGSGPMLTDLLRGEVDVAFEPMLSGIEHIRAGTVRALAVTTASRSEALPDLPTVAEFVPGYQTSGWTGVGVPSSTPAEVIKTLNREINTGLADLGIKQRLAELGGSPLFGSDDEFAKFVIGEIEKWRKVIRSANIKPV